MDTKFTTQRMFIAVTAIAVAIFVWMLVDLQMLQQGYPVAPRDFVSELLMFLTLAMRPLSVFVATVSLLGLQRGIKAGIWIICLLAVTCWLIFFVKYA